MSYINESIIYNIYPLGFCGAPRENDGQLVYRLDKIYDCIEHFKKLNVNAIVFNPIFESSRHGYDTIDYRRVDCRLGDNHSFKKICETLHENGIKVILDGVFNHVGRDFFAFKDVQKNLHNSRYCSWFMNLNFNGGSPMDDPFWYDGWAGCYGLVKLNLYNDEVVNYLLDAVSFWIDEFDIDGLRIDAANCIDVNFFRKLRKLCKSKKPEFWMYGEILGGDFNRIANNEMLDSVTNYECFKGLYSSHNDHNYFEIAHSLNRLFGNGGISQNIYTYNFVDNHDVNRLASTLRDKNHLKNVYTMMYAMPGVPSIYYGSEFAVEGMRGHNCDYDLRPCLDLNNVPNANYDLFNHIVKLGKIRHALEALKYGRFENVNIMNEKLVFKRFTDNQTVFLAFNLTDRDEKIGFDARCCAKLTDVLNDNEAFDVTGWCELDMKPYSARILVVNDGNFKLDFENKPETKKEPQEAEITRLTEVKLGKYRHFKGNEYEVIAIAKHSETEETLVIYRNVNDLESVWARPYDMFTDIVERDGKKSSRFTPLF